jgi:hypothetical protein
MEEIPVETIIGLFHAISQQFPSFLEWNTKKHHHLLYSDEAACELVTGIKSAVTEHCKCKPQVLLIEQPLSLSSEGRI